MSRFFPRVWMMQLLRGFKRWMSWLSSPEITAVLSGLFAYSLAQVLTNLLARPETFVILCYSIDFNRFLNTEPTFYKAPKTWECHKENTQSYIYFFTFLNRKSFTRITFLIDCELAHASVQIVLFPNERNFAILLFILCMTQVSLQATAAILFCSVG